MYKLFMSLLNTRLLSHHAKLVSEGGNGLLSTEQRGFRPQMSGCNENGAMLRKLQHLVLAKQRHVWVMWFDFKNERLWLD
jgi:hypothetical protein